MQGMSNQSGSNQAQQQQNQSQQQSQQQQGSGGNNGSNQQQQQQQPRQSTIDVPVRILVPSESVGAIIGKGGQTIRQLTQQTRAKVDVYRGDPMAPSNALQEKVITIRGQPENCINACREILKVMRQDAESKNKPTDIPLKVLAHNDYIGRIIGKQGNIINTIKKETDTSVTVSSINDMSMNVERVITVKGELENMIKALEIIHAKVKSAFENDTKTYGAQAIMMGGLPPLPLAPPAFAAAASSAAAAAAAAAAAQQQHGQGQSPSQTGRDGSGAPSGSATGAGSGQSGASQNAVAQGATGAAGGAPGGPGAQAGAYATGYYQPLYHPQAAPHGIAHQAVYGTPALIPSQAASIQHGGNGLDLSGQMMEPETVFLYIPNVAVGAIIGTKGSYIKNIIKLSGASVKITPLPAEETKTAPERQVVIVGMPDSQWKAQYYIYEKIRQERFATDDNVKLRAEIQVPAHIVGRIIGKSGKNVRELQRTTGATIKLPEDGSSSQHQQQQEGEGQVGEGVTATASATSQENEQAAGGEKETAAVANDESVKTSESNDAAGNAENAAEQSQEEKEKENTKSSSPDLSPNASNANVANGANSNFVTVRIFGTFQASQCAQRRILSLVSQSLRGVASQPSPLNSLGAHPGALGPLGGAVPLMAATHYRGEYQHGGLQSQHHPRTNGSNGRRTRHQHQQQQHSSKEANSTNSVQTNGTASSSSSSSSSSKELPKEATNGNSAESVPAPSQSPAPQPAVQQQAPALAAASA